jgi:hypothetical protein
MTMPDNRQMVMPPEDDPETGVHTATSLQQHADPAFQPASVQMSQNAYSGYGNGTSDNTLSVTAPYQKAMRDQLKAGAGETP